MATPASRAACGVRGANGTPASSICPASGTHGAAEHFHQRAFAGAVLADQRQHFAPSGRQGDTFERLRGPKALADVDHSQQRVGHDAGR